MKVLRTLTLVAASLSLAATASLAESEQHIDARKVERLETAYDKASSGARTIGKKRLHHQNRMNKLDDVLQRLESNEPVDPSEIDRLLRP